MRDANLLPTSALRGSLCHARVGSIWLKVTNAAMVKSHHPTIINPCSSETHPVSLINSFMGTALPKGLSQLQALKYLASWVAKHSKAEFMSRLWRHDILCSIPWAQLPSLQGPSISGKDGKQMLPSPVVCGKPQQHPRAPTSSPSSHQPPLSWEMLSLALPLETGTSPWDNCLCSSLDASALHCFSSKKKKNQEKAGDLPTESHGCRDGGTKKGQGIRRHTLRSQALTTGVV